MSIDDGLALCSIPEDGLDPVLPSFAVEGLEPFAPISAEEGLVDSCSLFLVAEEGLDS